MDSSTTVPRLIEAQTGLKRCHHISVSQCPSTRVTVELFCPTTTALVLLPICHRLVATTNVSTVTSSRRTRRSINTRWIQRLAQSSLSHHIARKTGFRTVSKTTGFHRYSNAILFPVMASTIGSESTSVWSLNSPAALPTSGHLPVTRSSLPNELRVFRRRHCPTEGHFR